MTKENLLDKLEVLSSHNKSGVMLTVIREFFESNVCIPKGANRHTYADVLHEYVEGIEIQCNENGSGWYNLCHFPHTSEYRIKPYEPVYEWYCLYKPTLSNEWQPNGYMSQPEIMEWKSQHGDAWSITYVDSTKRERK